MAKHVSNPRILRIQKIKNSEKFIGHPLISFYGTQNYCKKNFDIKNDTNRVRFMEYLQNTSSCPAYERYAFASDNLLGVLPALYVF